MLQDSAVHASPAARCFPPSQGRGWHWGGVTFQCSEVALRTILSSWSELCFLPRQNWQSMGKFYFERWNLSHFIAAEKFWMGKSRNQNSLSQSSYILTVIPGSSLGDYLTSPPTPPYMLFEFNSPVSVTILSWASFLLSLIIPCLPSLSASCLQSLKCRHAPWIHFFLHLVHLRYCTTHGCNLGPLWFFLILSTRSHFLSLFTLSSRYSWLQSFSLG